MQLLPYHCTYMLHVHVSICITGRGQVLNCGKPKLHAYVLTIPAPTEASCWQCANLRCCRVGLFCPPPPMLPAAGFGPQARTERHMHAFEPFEATTGSNAHYIASPPQKGIVVRPTPHVGWQAMRAHCFCCCMLASLASNPGLLHSMSTGSR